ncbi:Kelch-like protein 2, partial [Lamellibrachia satsuma]
YRNEFLDRMMKQRQNEKFTDVTLVSGDYRGTCHRSVLAAASPYFHTMFTSGLPDSESDTVKLNIDQATLKLVVDYIHSAEIKITVDNVQNLVESSDLLLLDDLKAECDQFMSNQVQLDNRLDMYKYASLYRLELLQRTARRLMAVDFMSVVSTSEFRELPCKELIEYISDDDVNVDTEDAVFEAVLNWVRHDLSERKSFLMKILEHVRLQFCTRSYLDNVV